MRNKDLKRIEKEAKKALKNEYKKDSKHKTESFDIRAFAKEKVNLLKNTDKKETTIAERDSDELYPLTLASEYLPIKDIIDGIILTSDNRFVKIMEIEPVNFELKADYEKTSIINSFENYLRLIPSKCQIKVVSRKATANELTERLIMDKSKEKYEKVGRLYDDHKRFIESLANKDAISRNYYMVFEYRPENKLSVNNFNKAKEQLEESCATASMYLKKCGCTMVNESFSKTHEQARILYNILNRERANNIPFEIHLPLTQKKWCELNGKENLDRMSINEMISPNKISFTNSKYVKVDNTYYAHLFISANSFPNKVDFAWTSYFTNLGEGVDVDIFINKEDRDTMEEKVFRATKLNKIRYNDYAEKDGEGQHSKELSASVDSGEYIRNGLLNKEDFFYTSIMITLVEYSEDALFYKIKQLKKLMKSMQMETYNCSMKQEQAFNMYLPLLKIDKSIYRATRRNVLTSGLASYFPFTSYELSSKNGIVIGVANQNNSLFTLDRFDTTKNTNANLCVLGSSGAGKTYFISLLAERERLRHNNVYIISPIKAEEFGRINKAVNGSFITIAPGSNSCINVMEIRPKDLSASKYIDGGISITSYMVEKTQSLIAFMSLLVPDITLEEKQLVDEAIVKTYKKFGITEDNNSIYDENGQLKTMPILGDLHQTMLEYKDLKRVANILRRLVTGSAKNFNQQTNVDLSNEFTVIDVSKLTGDMLIVGMYVALEYVWSKTRENRTVQKTIFIDELWKLLGSSSNELVAQMVLEIWKTARGYGVSAVGSTQDLVDFNGKYGKGIINNSNTKMILKIDNHKEAMAIQESLNLTDNELREIEGLEKGQSVLLSNHNNMTINILASELEHRLITTDIYDLQKIANRKNYNI